jgi:hypothetical protein
MDVCLIINTCKKNFSNLESLVDSIEKHNFPKQNVIIVSGQETENSVAEYRDIRFIKVMYTGLHLTAAIYLSEHIDTYSNINYWALLPDTIRFGHTFFDNFMYYYTLYLKNKNVYSLPFVNISVRRTTMDMGIVHTSHIVNMKDYLQQIKTYEINRANLIRLKLQLISNENTILGLEATNPHLSIMFKTVDPLPRITTYITNSNADIIETIIDNGETNQVYFKLLDLYKFQKNFRGFDNLVLSI